MYGSKLAFVFIKLINLILDLLHEIMSGQNGFFAHLKRMRNGHPNAGGARLVFHLRIVQLTDHVCVHDNVHARFLKNMYGGKSISVQDVKNYPLLSDSDYTDLDSPWYLAPILVTCNNDKYDMTHEACIRYAKAHNTHVL